MRRVFPTLRALVLALTVVIPAAAGAQEPEQSAARRAADLPVRAGDRISVKILQEPELSDTVTVNERGETAFAKLGVLRVGEMTIGQLQDSLRTLYSQYLRNPALDIVVLRRVAVNGEVENPDIYMVDVSTTLRDVIAKAGGVTAEGNRNKVEIVRDGERIRVRNWESASGTVADLHSGDQVVVHRKSWWALNALPAVSTVVLVVSVIATLTR